MDNSLELYCVVDEFCKAFIPEFEKSQLECGVKRKQRACNLSYSQIMTILIYFHQFRFRDFKAYYTHYVQLYLRKEFPDLVSYNRFVELMPSVLLPLCFFVHFQEKSATGVYFVDATTPEVCHVKRAYSNKVFDGLVFWV